MPLNGPKFNIQLTPAAVSLGAHCLESDPLPGAEIMIDGQSYLVMERRNRYTLRINRYELAHVLLLVKAIRNVEEKSWHNGQWVIGDKACQFNARSPFIRCTIKPDGPCETCQSFQAITEGG